MPNLHGCCPVLLLSIVILTVFSPHRGIAAFAHFYRECRIPKGSHGRKQEKNPITKRTLTYVHTRTFPYKPTVTWLWLLYSSSELYNVELTVCKTWIFYYLRKYEVFTLTQTCEVKVEVTVSKNCDPLFSLMTPFICSMGRVDPKVENPGKNSVLTLIIF